MARKNSREQVPESTLRYFTIIVKELYIITCKYSWVITLYYFHNDHNKVTDLPSFVLVQQESYRSFIWSFSFEVDEERLNPVVRLNFLHKIWPMLLYVKTTGCAF